MPKNSTRDQTPLARQLHLIGPEVAKVLSAFLKERPMTFRQHQLLRLRELLEQLLQLHDQLQWCQEEATNEYLADSMLRALEQCRKMCLSLKAPQRMPLAN